jgi:hypothetical protein
MSDRSAAADHRPLSDTARDRIMGNAVTANVVTWLGARLATADAADRSVRSPGGARG